MRIKPHLNVDTKLHRLEQSNNHQELDYILHEPSYSERTLMKLMKEEHLLPKVVGRHHSKQSASRNNNSDLNCYPVLLQINGIEMLIGRRLDALIIMLQQYGKASFMAVRLVLEQIIFVYFNFIDTDCD